MSEMTATRIVGAATLVVWIAAAALLWRTEVPGDLRLPDVKAAELFPAEHVEEADEYAGGHRLLWAGSTLVSLALLALLAWRPPPGRRPLLVLVAVLAALWLARLPFGVAAHWWRRRHGISSQGYLDWLVSPWLDVLGGLAAAVIALLLAIALERRLGRHWWLAGGPALAVLGAAVVLAQPLLWAPRLEPLRDRELAGDISALAAELGVEVDRVDVKDASDRTVRANAEVVGLGPTRTVVLWDTLLDGRFERGEIRWVAAHELGHVGRSHLWKGLAWLGLLSVPIAWIVARAAERRGGVGRPAAVPVVVLAAVAVELALLPLTNAISRRYEAEADWVALEATRDPDAATGLLRKFSLTGLSDPDPPAWSRALLSSHPPLVDRVAMARAWELRRPGARPREGS
jgi:STE24 endopeptidase